MSFFLPFVIYSIACTNKESSDTSASDLDTSDLDTSITEEDSAETDEPTSEPTDEPPCTIEYDPYPFIAEVHSYEPGEGAGFGQDQYPDIVYGPPTGAGENAGSLDVLSLGENGSIVFSFLDIDIIDGEGPDIIIFENSFVGWVEPGIAEASMDGESWTAWPCDLETYEGCIGLEPVLSNPDNCIDAQDPTVAGGDALDLADIGLSQIRYVRIRDAGVSGPGGFDLDAAAAIHITERE